MHIIYCWHILCDNVTEGEAGGWYNKEKARGAMNMAMMKIDEMNFAEVIGGGEPVLVEFGAPWCVYCRRIEPALKKVAEQYDGKLLVGAVDIDVSPRLAEEYEIELVPTLVLFKDGQAVGDVVNPASKAQIDAWIRETVDIG
jgi:thioredoxin